MAKVLLEVPDEIWDLKKSKEATESKLGKPAGAIGRRTLKKEFGFTEYKANLYGHILKHGQEVKTRMEAEGDKIKTVYTQDQVTVDATTLTLITEDDLCNVANIDRSKWEIKHFETGTWQTTMKTREIDSYDKNGKANYRDVKHHITNYRTKAVLVPRKLAPFEDALRDLISEGIEITVPKNYRRRYFGTLGTSNPMYAGELDPYDVHIGKLAWGRETGQGNYDLKIAVRRFLNAVHHSCETLAKFNVSKIYYVFGNDFIHSENLWGTTARGQHKLDVEGRFPKIIKAAQKAILESVYMALQVAPVNVIWVPGNHDYHASYHLALLMWQHFRDTENKHVTVDITPGLEKARSWGDLLVGWTHDGHRRQNNLVNMLPTYFPKQWGRSKFREWHVGHKHFEKETKFIPTLNEAGVVIRQLNTLSEIDFWHADSKWISAIPAMKSFLWHKRAGVCGNFTTYADYVDENNEMEAA